MAERITLEKLEKGLTFFNKMYDAVRIVDPVQKKVLESRGCSIEDTNEICYTYWLNGRICDNCISVRAYHENKSYMKLEQNANLIMAVTALPVETAERPIVLELLKNATDSMMIGLGDYNDGRMMRNLVSEMNDMAMKDSLTSLFNRRYISDRLPAEIVKASIEEWPISVILMDIDNLKYVNDHYGHLVGDQVLVEVGKVISNSIRGHNDWSARYGGDEFLICLNNTDSNEAHDIAERVRGNIENIMIPMKNGKVYLTASLGVHTMKDMKITAEEMIGLADRNMYEAKESGRNRTISGQDMQN